MDISEILQGFRRFLVEDLTNEVLSPHTERKSLKILEQIDHLLHSATPSVGEDSTGDAAERSGNTPSASNEEVPFYIEFGCGSHEETGNYVEIDEEPPSAATLASSQSGASSRNNSEASNSHKESNIVVSSEIFIQNQKLNFLNMKARWNKRFASVKDQCLQCYHKETDAHPYLTLPLNAYNITLRKHEENSMCVSLTMMGDPQEEHRFYVVESKTEVWCAALKRNFKSVLDNFSPERAPTPHLRPASTLTSPQLHTKDETKEENEVDSDVQKFSWLEVRSSSEEVWTKRMCLLQPGKLHCYSRVKKEHQEIDLTDCRVLISSSSSKDQSFEFSINRQDTPIIFLKAGSREEMIEWVGAVMAETTGAVTSPDDVCYEEWDFGYYVTPNPLDDDAESAAAASCVKRRSIYMKRRLTKLKDSTTEEPSEKKDEARVRSRTLPEAEEVGAERRAEEVRRAQSFNKSEVEKSLEEAELANERSALIKMRNEIDHVLHILGVKMDELNKYHDESLNLGITLPREKLRRSLLQTQRDRDAVLRRRDVINRKLERVVTMTSAEKEDEDRRREKVQPPLQNPGTQESDKSPKFSAKHRSKEGNPPSTTTTNIAKGTVSARLQIFQQK